MKKQKLGKPKKKIQTKKPKNWYTSRKTHINQEKIEILENKTSDQALIESIGESISKINEEKASERRLLLMKSPFNPIIRPRIENSWEAYQTFNPGVLFLNEKIL